MSTRLFSCALLALALGCGDAPAVAADPPPTPAPAEATPEPTPDPAMTTLQPAPPTDFTPGPALAPSKDLLAWLEAHKTTRIRLPVVIRFKDEYRMNWGAITIGTALGTPAADAIHLKLDDTRMGVGLMDRLVDEVPEADAGCVRWLEGTWGAAMDGPDLSEFEPAGPKRHPFAVTAIAEGVPGDARVQVAQ